MANIKYFNDSETGSIELKYQMNMPNEEFRIKFPDIKGLRYDGYSMCVGSNELNSNYVPITRKITYKDYPSKHECNTKCLNGKHNGMCECKCGGKNHGAGLFTNLV